MWFSPKRFQTKKADRPYVRSKPTSAWAGHPSKRIWHCRPICRRVSSGFGRRRGWLNHLGTAPLGNAALLNAESIKKLITDGVKCTSAVCVLIGTETWGQRWVRYE